MRSTESGSSRLEGILVGLLPPTIRDDYGDEAAEHLRWLRRVHAKRLGPVRFWVFVWTDFLRVGLTGRPVAWAFSAVAVVGITALFLMPHQEPDGTIPMPDISISVESADEAKSARFFANVEGGVLDVRNPDGEWRRVRRGEEMETPSELILRGRITEAQFASTRGSPEVRFSATASTAHLKARGSRVKLERTRTRIGVRVLDRLMP